MISTIEFKLAFFKMQIESTFMDTPKQFYTKIIKKNLNVDLVD